MAERLSARAIIRISAVPDPGLNRALGSSVESARRAGRQIERDFVAGGKARERAEKQLALVAAREAKQRERTAAEEARYKQRVAEQGARLQIAMNAQARRDSERLARQQIRDAQRVAREEERTFRQRRDARRALLAGVGGAAMGAGMGAYGLVQRGQGLAGVGTLEQRLETAGQFRQQLIRTSGEGKLTSEERIALEQKVIGVSVDTNKSLLELADGLDTAQTRFDALRDFAENLPYLAKVSQAKGKSLDELIGAVGTARQAFQLTPAEQREFTDLMIATSSRGSIDVGETARELAPTMGTFALNTKRTGIGAAREFLALSQTVGGSAQVGGAETATMLRDFVGRLALPAVQRELRTKAGVTVTNKDGTLKDIGEIGALLAGSKKFQRAEVRKDIFTDLQARQGAEFLMQAIQRDATAFTSLRDVSATEGAQEVEGLFKTLKDDPSFKLAGIGVNAQAKTAQDMDRLVTAMHPVVEGLTGLQSQFPLFAESVGIFRDAALGLMTGLVANRLAFGPLARGAGALLPGAAGAAGAGAAAAGGAGVMTMAAGALAAGAAGYFGTSALLGASGTKTAEDAGGWVHDLFFGDAASFIPRTSVRGAAATAAGGGSATLDPDSVKALGEAVAEGNRRDPVMVKIKVEDGRTRVSSVSEGEGASVDLGGVGPMSYSLP